MPAKDSRKLDGVTTGAVLEQLRDPRRPIKQITRQCGVGRNSVQKIMREALSKFLHLQDRQEKVNAKKADLAKVLIEEVNEWGKVVVEIDENE